MDINKIIEDVPSTIELNLLDSYCDFEKFRLENFDKRYLKELTFAKENVTKIKFQEKGYCLNCKKHVVFDIIRTDDKELIPNFRESIICPECKMNNRSRFMLAFVNHIMEDSIRDIYLYEQITPFYQSFKNKFPSKQVIGSEYLSPNLKSGEFKNGIRHEDAQDLSFKDNSFDLLISCDVLEHVPDFKKCLFESSRILRENGRLLISIPFYYNNRKTEQRAQLLENGSIEYLKEKQYHGNPLSSKGSLVFWDYGWDFLDAIKEANFRKAYLFSYYSFECGHIGVFQHIFVAEK